MKCELTPGWLCKPSCIYITTKIFRDHLHALLALMIVECHVVPILMSPVGHFNKDDFENFGSWMDDTVCDYLVQQAK